MLPAVISKLCCVDPKTPGKSKLAVKLKLTAIAPTIFSFG
jgi:hypothetical protein